MRRRQHRRRLDPIRSIGLLGGFGSIAKGFDSIADGMGGLMGVDVGDPGDGNGRWVFKRKQPHDCVLPGYGDASWGDVWECGDCGSQWTVTNDEQGKLKMVRAPAPPAWYGGQTTGTGGYGYTWTTPSSYWYSSSTRIEGGPPPEVAGGSENP